MIESFDHIKFVMLSRICVESSVPSLVICENLDLLCRDRKIIFGDMIQAC
jgi:hypothetical protein